MMVSTSLVRERERERGVNEREAEGTRERDNDGFRFYDAVASSSGVVVGGRVGLTTPQQT